MTKTEFKKCSDILGRGMSEGLHKNEIIDTLRIMLTDITNDENETFSEEDGDFIGRNITEVCEAYTKEYNQEDLDFVFMKFNARCSELYDFLHEKFKPIEDDCVPNVNLKAASREDVAEMTNIMNLIHKHEKEGALTRIVSFPLTFLYLIIHASHFYENYFDMKNGQSEDGFYRNYGYDMKKVNFKDKVGFLLYAFKYTKKYIKEVKIHKEVEESIRKEILIATPQLLTRLSGIQK